MTLPELPIDTKASRLHRDVTSFDDVFDSLREYERLARVADPGYTVVSTFTADAVTWTPVWLAPEPPGAVRTVVVRDGVTTDEYRSWVEARPADEEGQARWDANPSTFLRAFTERAALRRAFADVIVGRVRVSPVTNGVDIPQLVGSAILADERAWFAERLEAAVMPTPRPPRTPMPRGEAPEVRARRRAPKPPTALEQALRDAELASGKTVTRKASSRSQRDSGKRRGGRS